MFLGSQIMKNMISKIIPETNFVEQKDFQNFLIMVIKKFLG